MKARESSVDRASLWLRYDSATTTKTASFEPPKQVHGRARERSEWTRAQVDHCWSVDRRRRHRCRRRRRRRNINIL